jgi:hypothetical protein
VRTHAATSGQVDTWVGRVGAGFLVADAGSGPTAITEATSWLGRNLRTFAESSAKHAGVYSKLFKAGKFLVEQRTGLQAFIGGVRITPKAPLGQWLAQQLTGTYKGFYVVRGSREALVKAGMNPQVRRFSEKYVKRMLAVKQGPLAPQAKGIMKYLAPKRVLEGIRSTPTQLKSAFGFGGGWKGLVKSPAFLTSVVTLGLNAYEFSYGKNKDIGLFSRQFVTATVADLSVGLGIVGFSTVIGSCIPIPFVGTAVGFAVGVGLQFAYDKWLKDKWRGAVDRAGQAIQSKVTDTVRAAQHAVLEAKRSVARTANALGRGLVQQAGRTLREAVTRPLWSPPRLWVGASM